MNKRIIIVAHRGASEVAPENTIPSFDLAFKENADFIEGDFWLTKDEQIVCIHDPNTKRVTSGKFNLNVRSTSLYELKKLDVGFWKGEQFKNTRIPTLEEVLEIIPNGKGIYIEIKDDREIILERLSEILSKPYILKEKVIIITFHSNIINLAKKYLPGVKVYWLFGLFIPNIKPFNSLVKMVINHKLKTLKCDGVNIKFASYIDEKLVNSVRQNNFDFCVYNVETSAEAERLAKMGIDSITTNSPLKIRKAL